MPSADAHDTPVTLTQCTGASVVEGSTISYRAQVSSAVSCFPTRRSSDLGQQLTIAVGQTVGTVDYVVRADDAYVQADDNLSVTITGNTVGRAHDLTPATP